MCLDCHFVPSSAPACRALIVGILLNPPSGIFLDAQIIKLMLNTGSNSERKRLNIQLDQDLVDVGLKRKAELVLGRLERTGPVQPLPCYLVLGSP